MLKSIEFQLSNYIIDLFFFSDMVLAFRTCYIDDSGAEVSDTKLIAYSYLKSTFFIDFLATMPFDKILELFDAYNAYVERVRRNEGNQWIEVLGILKLGRILRLNKII